MTCSRRTSCRRCAGGRELTVICSAISVVIRSVISAGPHTVPLDSLRKCNYDVTVVTDGRAALAALEESEARPAEERHHLVLSDVVMRDIDGPASASATRRPCSRTRVIVC